MGQKLAEALLDLILGDHICYIYETKEQMNSMAPFLMQGLERNEQCLYIADENSVAEVTEALERRGINVSALVSSGQLNIVTKAESYVKDGYFDPDQMIGLLQRNTELAISKGYQGLRGTGEMTWALAGHRGSERLLEYEAKLNYFFYQNRALAVCQYNANKFPYEVLLDIIKVHPLVIYGDFVCRNFYYVPPDEFLRGKKDAEGELRRSLHYIAEREELDRKLRDYTARLEHKIGELNALNDLFQKFLAEHFELKEAYRSLNEAVKGLADMTEVRKQKMGPGGNILHALNRSTP